MTWGKGYGMMTQQILMATLVHGASLWMKKQSWNHLRWVQHPTLLHLHTRLEIFPFHQVVLPQNVQKWHNLFLGHHVFFLLKMSASIKLPFHHCFPFFREWLVHHCFQVWVSVCLHSLDVSLTHWLWAVISVCTISEDKHQYSAKTSPSQYPIYLFLFLLITRCEDV